MFCSHVFHGLNFFFEYVHCVTFRRVWQTLKQNESVVKQSANVVKDFEKYICRMCWVNELML